MTRTEINMLRAIHVSLTEVSKRGVRYGPRESWAILDLIDMIEEMESKVEEFVTEVKKLMRVK